MIIFALCGCINNEVNLLSAETLSASSYSEKIEVYQHRPHREQIPHQKSIMGKQDFQYLYKVIKKKSFNDDRLELLSVGVLDNYFTCRQCAKLMSIFSFDDNKLEALEIMAEHIVDRENMYLIIDTISFNSNKEKAIKLLSPHRR